MKYGPGADENGEQKDESKSICYLYIFEDRYRLHLK